MTGNCHCGAVTVQLTNKPVYLNDCDCSLCSRIGALWGNFDPADVTIEGETRFYTCVDRERPRIGVHFCGICGSTTHWTPMPHIPQDRMGVNMRLFSANAVAGVELRHPVGSGWVGSGPYGYRRPSSKFAGEPT